MKWLTSLPLTPAVLSAWKAALTPVPLSPYKLLLFKKQLSHHLYSKTRGAHAGWPRAFCCSQNPCASVIPECLPGTGTVVIVHVSACPPPQAVTDGLALL